MMMTNLISCAFARFYQLPEVEQWLLMYLIVSVCVSLCNHINVCKQRISKIIWSIFAKCIADTSHVWLWKWLTFWHRSHSRWLILSHF